MTRHATTHHSAEGTGPQEARRSPRVPIIQPRGSEERAPTAPSAAGLSRSRWQGRGWATEAAPCKPAGARAISRTGRATPGARKHPAQEEEEEKAAAAAAGGPPVFPQPQ